MINVPSEMTGAEQVEWNAVYTRHQHEKLVAESLAGNGFEVFLPTYNVIRKWTDRKKQLSLPLFPCYVFRQRLQNNCGFIRSARRSFLGDVRRPAGSDS